MKQRSFKKLKNMCPWRVSSRSRRFLSFRIPALSISASVELRLTPLGYESPFLFINLLKPQWKKKKKRHLEISQTVFKKFKSNLQIPYLHSRVKLVDLGKWSKIRTSMQNSTSIQQRKNRSIERWFDQKLIEIIEYLTCYTNHESTPSQFDDFKTGWMNSFRRGFLGFANHCLKLVHYLLKILNSSK